MGLGECVYCIVAHVHSLCLKLLWWSFDIERVSGTTYGCLSPYSLL